MKCKSCGSDLQRLEYQSRSADEAHTVVYRCPLCPINVEKFFNKIPKQHLYLERFSSKRQKTPIIDSSIAIKSLLLCVTSKDHSLISGLPRYQAKSCNYIDSESRLFKSYLTGPWIYRAISSIQKRDIGLNAWVEDILYVEDSPSNQREYIDFEYTMFEDYLVVIGNGLITVVQECVVGSNDNILSHLCSIYLIGFAPMDLPSYINRVALGSMSNMSARAYDAPTASDNDHSFSTKPDGERMWLVKSGSTWLYCRRLRDYEVSCWFIDSNLSYIDRHSISPILDVEIMIGFSPILIDILMDENGKLSPYDRNLEWIHSKMQFLVSKFNYLQSIHIRQFFNTMHDADLYSQTVKYPIDGLVAISSSGTDMKKLKPIKSAELEVQEDMTLTTKEGNTLFKLQNASEYEPGTIVEVKFSILNKQVQVHEVFQRFDKRSANTNAAIDSILESAVMPASDNMVRTLLWRWSNKLRFYLYERAYSMNKAKNIVLDIGSGSGQSTEAFSKMPDCSFILVEPDEQKCKSLAKRLKIHGYHTSPRSVIPVIMALKQGTRKYHILNMDFDKILYDKPVMNNLKDVVKCAIASFSAQFISERADIIAYLGIPFIGCYYSYKGLNIGDSIIRTSGIEMTKTSATLATVKWGSDEIYTEPVSDPAEDCLSLNELDAIEIIEPPMSNTDDPIYTACSHVKVLISA